MDPVQCFEGDGVPHGPAHVVIPEGHLNNYRFIEHCAYIVTARPQRIDMGKVHELSFTTGRPNRLIRDTVNSLIQTARDGGAPVYITIEGWESKPMHFDVMALCDWQFDGRFPWPLWTRLYFGPFLTHQRFGTSLCVDRGVPPRLDGKNR